jgi:hypothetical protein
MTIVKTNTDNELIERLREFGDGDRWFTFTPLVLPLSSIGEV